MKMRAGIVIILVLLATVGGAVVGVYHYTMKPAEPSQAAAPAAKEDKFIEEARELAKANPSGETGLLPPVTANATEVPVIAVEPAALDMGVVAGDGTAAGEIKVLNQGKANLEISQVSTSCGCTKASINEPHKKTVPPGGSTIINVTIDPKRITEYDAEKNVFRSTKSVTIASNDPERPRMNVQVTAGVSPEFSVEPRDVLFGDVKKGESVEKTMVVRQLGEEPIEVLEVAPFTKGNDLQLSFVKRPEAEWKAPNRPEYTITVRLPEDAAPGPFDSRFRVQTTCKRMPQMICTAKANVQSFYTVNPKSVMIRTDPQTGKPAPAFTTITADRPFEIVDLHASGDDLVFNTKPGQTPNSQILEVNVKPETESAQRNEIVNFAVKSGDETLKDRINVRVITAHSPVAGGPEGAPGATPNPKPVRRPMPPFKPPMPGVPPPTVAPGAPAPAPVPSAPAPAAPPAVVPVPPAAAAPAAPAAPPAK